MDEIKPSGKTSHEDYFKKLIVLAANEKNFTLKIRGSVPTKVNESPDSDKINKNRKDAQSRLASERGAEVKDAVKAPHQRRGLSSAIEDALETLARQGVGPNT